MNNQSVSEGLPRSGLIAIVGRPNVGKSTLLNHLVEQKISITSRKPQTTRHNITGIKTIGETQMVFIDTPGIHLGQERALNRYMNRAASSALNDVDVVLFVVDQNHWTDDDENVLRQVNQSGAVVIVVINKVDQLGNKDGLLPAIEKLSKELPRAEIVPVSALSGKNLDLLEKLIVDAMPSGEHLYPDDQVTDRSVRFLSAEIIREKITRQLGAELPYQITVEIEDFKQEAHLATIHALVLVERDGQKKILIGEKGSRLKSIGQQARIDMEKMLETKVMLKIWVKVKSGWSDDDRALRSLGYES